MHKSSDGVLERRQIDQVLVLIEPKPNTIQPSPAAQSILVNIGVRKKYSTLSVSMPSTESWTKWPNASTRPLAATKA